MCCPRSRRNYGIIVLFCKRQLVEYKSCSSIFSVYGSRNPNWVFSVDG
ncbi:hypothetical protein SLEP1_g3815 [Rubroshorea leprosula]|uniref:Uncharacterized protein n=1 Tax=Rubroshorea leprosula TaxID=152421 RepID=A0AAV5HW24_9ROSI|nr:hypothetical protein SLEP1_g3815 [Rubroshorea leprosula]